MFPFSADPPNNAGRGFDPSLQPRLLHPRGAEAPGHQDVLTPGAGAAPLRFARGAGQSKTTGRAARWICVFVGDGFVCVRLFCLFVCFLFSLCLFVALFLFPVGWKNRRNLNKYGPASAFGRWARKKEKEKEPEEV